VRNAARRPIMDKDRYIEKMGVALGTQFCALWEQVVWLHMKWADFVELFGKKPSRIVVLDQAAPAFFRMIRDVLWDDMLLHIARLVDKPKKDCLTIQSLPRYVKDAVTKSAVEELIKTAKHETEFCRKPRDTLIAHTNIVVLTTAVLELGSRLQMTEALHALGNVLNEIETFYMGSPTSFDHVHTVGNAVDLLYVLHDGLRAAAARVDRIGRGQSFEDFPPADL
jgi:hypothetical protein